MVTDLMVEIQEVTGLVSQRNRQDLYHLFSVTIFNHHLCSSHPSVVQGLINDMVDFAGCVLQTCSPKTNK